MGGINRWGRGFALMDLLAALCVAGIGTAAVLRLSSAESAALHARHVESSALANPRFTCVPQPKTPIFTCKNSELANAQVTIITK